MTLKKLRELAREKGLFINVYHRTRVRIKKGPTTGVVDWGIIKKQLKELGFKHAFFGWWYCDYYNKKWVPLKHL